MENKIRLNKKMCSFYVSDLHFTTMILPYIIEKAKQESLIIPFLERDMEKNVEVLLSKLNLNKEVEGKVEKMNWSKSKLYKYTELQKYMDEKIMSEKEIYCIILGQEDYMKALNGNLNKYIEKRQAKLEKEFVTVNIINCFEVMQFNENIDEILKQHNKILNTSGEKEITDVFDGFGKKII